MEIPSGLLDILSIKPSNYVPPGLDPVTGVDSKDETIDANSGVDARIYLPPNSNDKKVPVLVYFHGGGFLFPRQQASSKNYHDLLNAIVFNSNVVAVSVNYRLAVQAQLPAAWDDSLTALKWVFSKADPWLAEHGDFEHVFVAGDSAGANITHNLTMLMSGPEGEGMGIEGALLLCPYFWGSKRIGTETDEQSIWVTVGWNLAGMSDLDDYRVNPIGDGAPSLVGLGCKRALVCTAGADPLVWRGRAYCEKLVTSGWKGWLEMKEYQGEGHDFFMGNLDAEDSKDLIAKLATFFVPSSMTGGN